MSALSRGRVVVLGLALGLAVLGAASRPWVQVDLSGMLTGSSAASVSGGGAAPVVPAVALVALAATAALTIARRVGRVLVAVVLVLAGLVVVLASLDVRSDPASAASVALAEQTAGLALAADQVTVTSWPLVTALLGTLLAILGVLVLVAGRSWAGGRRFESAPPDSEAPAAPRATAAPVDDWDAISRGDDPTTDDSGPARE